MINKNILFLLLFSLVFTACNLSAHADPVILPAISEPVPPEATLQPTLTVTPYKEFTTTPTPIPSTSTPTQTFTPTPTNTPLPSPTPTWALVPAGKVVAPILLYHHISKDSQSRYYVSPDNFRSEMESLRNWGYTTITPTFLVNVLINGGQLPSRPIIISFDDGNLDVYQNAFPVMKELGYVGAVYIVANRLESDNFLHADQLKELVAAGWEVGSHGMSHVDLTMNHSYLSREVLQSRLDLETAVGVPVLTIAYPFGTVDGFVAQKSQEYGYHAGMGLGTSVTHTWGTLYYLSRREVHGDMDLTTFAGLLPWSGSP